MKNLVILFLLSRIRDPDPHWPNLEDPDPQKVIADPHRWSTHSLTKIFLLRASLIHYGDLILDTCHDQNRRGVWGNNEWLSLDSVSSHNVLLCPVGITVQRLCYQRSQTTLRDKTMGNAINSWLWNWRVTILKNKSSMKKFGLC